MGGIVVDQHGQPAHLENDRGLVVDLARFREGLLEEKSIRKKYRFPKEIWECLADDDNLVRAVEEESVRRVRDGSVKRERAQIEVADAPPILGRIMRSPDSNARHVVDAVKVLDGLAGPPAGAAPDAVDRFIITINLGADSLTFNKSIKPDPADVDTGMLAAIANERKDGGGGEGHL